MVLLLPLLQLPSPTGLASSQCVPGALLAMHTAAPAGSTQQQRLLWWQQQI
jgi:hypothetical protein